MDYCSVLYSGLYIPVGSAKITTSVKYTQLMSNHLHHSVLPLAQLLEDKTIFKHCLYSSLIISFCNGYKVNHYFLNFLNHVHSKVML